MDKLNESTSAIKVKKLVFQELSPIYPVGTLLQISSEYTDTLCFLSVPTAATDPSSFIKAKDIKHATMIVLKSGDIIFYLGTYRNKIKGKITTYHRFLFEKTIIYAFDDAFIESSYDSYFVVISE